MNNSYSSILVSLDAKPRNPGLPKSILEQIGTLRVFHMIWDRVATTYGLQPHDLCQHTRKLPIREARQVVMWYGHRHLGIIQSTVGQQLGNKDHSTVWYACKVVQNLNGCNREFRERVKGIMNQLSIKEEIL